MVPPPNQLPGIEPLEARRLRASIGFSDHLLTVNGAAGASNTITVGGSVDLSTVVATVTYLTGPASHPRTHTLSKTIPLSDLIQAVHINGGNRADVITIDQTYEPFTIATTINAGGGNDTVTCGDEPDVVYGQGGADSINGGNRADVITIDQTYEPFTIATTINAGGGNDTVTCGDEPDVIYGQGGADSINGGGGNDVLIGGAGNDILIGGAGDDYLAGDGGHDYMEGDAGDDTLHDARGPDTILGGAGQNTFEIHSLRKDVDTDYDATKDTLHIIAAPGPGDTSTSLLGSLFPISSLL
jgi:Ca2+-binding RTX toxin-like protein